METTSELTYGQKAVGVNFNPSGNTQVDEVKNLYAVIIDLIRKNSDTNFEGRNAEGIRLSKIAVTEAQGACMWAVKAITYKE